MATGRSRSTLKEVTPSNGPAGIKVLKCVKDRCTTCRSMASRAARLHPTERIGCDVGPHTVEVYDVVSATRRKWDIVVKDTPAVVSRQGVEVTAPRVHLVQPRSTEGIAAELRGHARCYPALTMPMDPIMIGAISGGAVAAGLVVARMRGSKAAISVLPVLPRYAGPLTIPEVMAQLGVSGMSAQGRGSSSRSIRWCAADTSPRVRSLLGRLRCRGSRSASTPRAFSSEPIRESAILGSPVQYSLFSRASRFARALIPVTSSELDHLCAVDDPAG